MSEKDYCKHGLRPEWCADCNPARETLPSKRKRRRRTSRAVEREKRAKEELEREIAILEADHRNDWFTRRLKGRGKWHPQAEAVAKEEPRTREECRQALLRSLMPAIRGKAKNFAGTSPAHWGAYGYEWDERIDDYVKVGLEVIDEYLLRQEDGTLAKSLQGISAESAVAKMFNVKSLGWYWPKKLDYIVFEGRGLGGEEQYLIEQAETGDYEALERLDKFQREIRKINRERKRWLIDRGQAWGPVPKNIIIRACFENTLAEGAAWNGYCTWEQAELVIKWCSYRTNEELAEEMGKSRAQLYNDLKEAKQNIMPYAKAAIRFGWWNFLRLGIKFDPRKWKKEPSEAPEPEEPLIETDEELDAWLYGDAHDDIGDANEDEF